MTTRQTSPHGRPPKSLHLHWLSGRNLASGFPETLQDTYRTQRRSDPLEHLSLVIFTVLAQASAGLCLMMVLMQLSGSVISQDMMTRGYLVALVLLGVAGMASVTHLGRPFRVMNVMSGLAHGSPLSWEIAAVTVFGSLAFFTGALSLKDHPPGQFVALPLMTAIAGLLMVYAITRVYTLNTVRAWNTRWTLIQFMTSALLLGCVFGTVLLSFDNQSAEMAKTPALLVIGVVLLQLPLMTQFIGQLEGQLSVVIDSKLPFIRLIMLAAGCLTWLLPMTTDQPSVTFSMIAAVLLTGSEMAGRIYFYDLLNLRLM